MKVIKDFNGFSSNVKDALKNMDPYHIFKGSQSFNNRTKISRNSLDKLLMVLSSGLNIEDIGLSVWAWEKGNDQMEWKYDGEYLYYNDKYKKYIKKFTDNQFKKNIK